MEEKLWETEYWAINFNSGTLEKYISKEYVPAINVQQAAERLSRTGEGQLRLTGRWFRNEQRVSDYNEFYEKLSKPKTLTEDMSYDEFCDWLELGTEEDVKSAIKAFKEDGLDSHVEVMELHLKQKYGNKDKIDPSKDSEDDQEKEGS